MKEILEKRISEYESLIVKFQQEVKEKGIVDKQNKFHKHLSNAIIRKEECECLLEFFQNYIQAKPATLIAIEKRLEMHKKQMLDLEDSLQNSIIESAQELDSLTLAKSYKQGEMKECESILQVYNNMIVAAENNATPKYKAGRTTVDSFELSEWIDDDESVPVKYKEVLITNHNGSQETKFLKDGVEITTSVYRAAALRYKEVQDTTAETADVKPSYTGKVINVKPGIVFKEDREKNAALTSVGLEQFVIEQIGRAHV